MGLGPAALTAQQSSYIVRLLTPLPIPIQPTQYDEKGRQMQYVESTLQRRERIAFLKKREWARRVVLWLNHTALMDSVVSRLIPDAPLQVC